MATNIRVSQINLEHTKAFSYMLAERLGKFWFESHGFVLIESVVLVSQEDQDLLRSKILETEGLRSDVKIVRGSYDETILFPEPALGLYQPVYF